MIVQRLKRKQPSKDAEDLYQLKKEVQKNIGTQEENRLGASQLNNTQLQIDQGGQIQQGSIQKQDSPEFQQQVKKMREKILKYHQIAYNEGQLQNNNELKDEGASIICRYVLFHYGQNLNQDTLIPKEKLSTESLQKLQQESTRKGNTFGEFIQRAQAILAYKFGIELQEIIGDNKVQKYYIAKSLVPIQMLDTYLTTNKDKITHTNNLIVLAFVFMEDNHNIVEDQLIQKIEKMQIVQPSLEANLIENDQMQQNESENYIKNMVKQKYLQVSKEKRSDQETLVKVYKWGEHAHAEFGEAKIQNFIQMVKRLEV